MHGFSGGVVGCDGEGAIQRQLCFIVAGEITVPQRNPVKCVQVARIELKRALEALYGFFPPSLPPLDVSRQLGRFLPTPQTKIRLLVREHF
jgi:hypothetical protein